MLMDIYKHYKINERKLDKFEDMKLSQILKNIHFWTKWSAYSFPFR